MGRSVDLEIPGQVDWLAILLTDRLVSIVNRGKGSGAGASDISSDKRQREPRLPAAVAVLVDRFKVRRSCY